MLLLLLPKKFRITYTKIWSKICFHCAVCVISNLSRNVNQICAVLGFYLLLPYFQGPNNPSTSQPLKIGPTVCPETSVRNYRSPLSKIPEKGTSINLVYLSRDRTYHATEHVTW